MKKLFLMIITAFMTVGVFTGCVTDKAYAVTKTIYVGGKKIVINNADKLSPETLEKLEKLDDYAVKYDETRAVVRNTFDEVKDIKEK